MLLYKRTRFFLLLFLPYCLISLIVNFRQHSKVYDAQWQRDWQHTVPSHQNKGNPTTALSLVVVDTSWSFCNRDRTSHCNLSKTSFPRFAALPQPTNTTSKKQVIEVGVKNHAEPPYNANTERNRNCTCVDKINNFYCCQRAMITVHKMGFTVVQELTKKLYTASSDLIATPQIMSHHKFGRWFETDFWQPNITRDYRHVVVSRNWYDAILSGYLYHKSGKECWLDWFGKPDHDGWLLNNSRENWEQRLLNTSIAIRNISNQRNHPWPPGNGRDLCTYLAEESEADGLYVYAAWSMACFMQPLLDFRHYRLQMEKRQERNRTIFICYEQLISPTEFGAAMPIINRWLYPHKSHFTIMLPHRKYKGTHATNHDTTLRNRLYAILSKIDADIFHGTIAKGSQEFGCGRHEMLMNATRNQTQLTA